MYGTSPSKNVPRSCASSDGIASAFAGVVASAGGADVAGCVVDLAGAGGLATADGTCARHGAHRPASNSSEAKRFNMTCLLWRMGVQPDQRCCKAFDIPCEHAGRTAFAMPAIACSAFDPGSEIPADRNTEHARRDDRRVVLHPAGDRIELPCDRYVILEGARLHDAALVGQVLDVSVDVPLATVHAGTQIDGVVARNGRARWQRRQDTRDRIAEREVGRAFVDVLVGRAHIAVPAAA